jgi:hypothetical protein
MDEKVRDALERLHQHLDTVQTQDAAQQAHLNEMRVSVREALDQPNHEHHRTLRDRLTELVLKLDEGNPDITMAVKEAIDTLSQAGI